MIALIDGDILTYRIGASVEPRFYKIFLKDAKENGWINKIRYKKDAIAWVEEQGLTLDEVEFEVVKEAEPYSHALHNLQATMDNIMSGSLADDFIVYLTGSDNFRETVATSFPYKGNRDRDDRPLYYQQLRDTLINDYGAVVIGGMEADDALSLAQWEDYKNIPLLMKEQDAQTIICTLDKDLNMVPGWHYDWVKDKRYWVDDDMGLYSFFNQLLTGDTNDNIIGIKGIGTRTADTILQRVIGDDRTVQEAAKDVLEVIRGKYREAEIEDRFEENAILLWMLRERDTTWSDYV